MLFPLRKKQKEFITVPVFSLLFTIVYLWTQSYSRLSTVEEGPLLTCASEYVYLAVAGTQIIHTAGQRMTQICGQVVVGGPSDSSSRDY